MQPTLQDKKEFIRKRAIDANPSIKDLEFGCKFTHFLKGSGVIVGVEKYQNGESDCYNQYFYVLPEPLFDRSPFNNNWEIIGRDVRFCDILMILIMKNIYTMDNIEKLLIHWLLPIDSLDLQGEDTISCLYNLLQ